MTRRKKGRSHLFWKKRRFENIEIFKVLDLHHLVFVEIGIVSTSGELHVSQLNGRINCR